LLVGASAQRTADALTKSGFTNYKMSSAKDMSAITKEAVDLAQEGDAVVLSPGFSSFDMFKNFEVRGQKFNEAVEAL
jgi:UDP-N-acetylmuramoylalanine--D-glutamate ligase